MGRKLAMTISALSIILPDMCSVFDQLALLHLIYLFFVMAAADGMIFDVLIIVENLIEQYRCNVKKTVENPLLD